MADVALQPDDKIVVAGSVGAGSYPDFLLARYRADGSLDPSFGTGGIVTNDLGNSESWHVRGAAAGRQDRRRGEATMRGSRWGAIATDGSLDTVVRRMAAW